MDVESTTGESHMRTSCSLSLERKSEREDTTVLTASSLEPSTAIIAPLMAWAGEAGPGFPTGGEILARTLILLIGGIDMIIASTDLACVLDSESPVKVVFNGGRVNELSGEME